MSNDNENNDVTIEDEDHSDEYFSTSTEEQSLIKKNLFVDYRLIGFAFLLLILILRFWIRRKPIWKKAKKQNDSNSDSIDRYEQMNKIRLEQQKRYDQQVHQREILLAQKKKKTLDDELSNNPPTDSNDSNSNGQRRLRSTNNFDDKSSCSYRPQSRRSNGKRG